MSAQSRNCVLGPTHLWVVCNIIRRCRCAALAPCTSWWICTHSSDNPITSRITGLRNCNKNQRSSWLCAWPYLGRPEDNVTVGMEIIKPNFKAGSNSQNHGGLLRSGHNPVQHCTYLGVLQRVTTALKQVRAKHKTSHSLDKVLF